MTFRKDDDVPMTIVEVAAMHRVSRRTVDRWISNGKLASAKLPGGSVRIARADAVALLKPVDQPQTQPDTDPAVDTHLLVPASPSQSSTVAVDSTETTHAGAVPRPSVSSGAEDVPPTSSALPTPEAVIS
jgi:excisionase family DNA binding protein